MAGPENQVIARISESYPWRFAIRLSWHWQGASRAFRNGAPPSSTRFPCMSGHKARTWQHCSGTGGKWARRSCRERRWLLVRSRGLPPSLFPGARRAVLRLPGDRRAARHGLRGLRARPRDAQVTLPGGGRRLRLRGPRRLPEDGWQQGRGLRAGRADSAGDGGPPDLHADALGKPLLAARLQPQERAGAHQLPHRPRARHGEPLRPRPGEDGASLQPDRRGDDGDGAWTRPGRTSGDDALPCQGARPEGRPRPEPDSMETVPDPTPGDAARAGFRPWPSIGPKSAIQGGARLNANRNPSKESGRRS